MADRIEMIPVTALLGAVVEGVDLRARLSPGAVDAIRQGLAEHLVLFFRAQHLDDAAHLRLAGVLGTPMLHPFEGAMGRTDPLHRIVDTPERAPDRAGWHTDDSYLESPPGYAVLRCDEAPPAGGDTAWCNMVAAFEALSPAMQSFLAGLEGRHETRGSLSDYVRRHLPADRVAAAMAAVGDGATHPIVRRHPDSGRRALFFEQNFMTRIVGLSAEESEFVCRFLAEQVSDVSLQCRFSWSPGDVAIWDERTTQHIGAADHAGHRRVMVRCTVSGERPMA